MFDYSKADPRDFAYDIETFRHCFTAVFVHIQTQQRWIFEVSRRRTQAAQFIAFIMYLRSINARCVGYNNVGFDYVVIHKLIALGEHFTAESAHLLANEIIQSQNDNRFGLRIWDKDVLVQQVDPYLIHHFDNKAKSTGLKALEFAMRSLNIKDLPYPVDHVLTFEEMDKLIVYNCHDVDETIKFYFYSLEMIKFREQLSERIGKSYINYNDTKIGKQFFIQRLEEKLPGICGPYGARNQTRRPNGIPVGQIIFPYVRFQTPEFQRLLDYLRSVVIRDTRSPPELKGVSIRYSDFQFDVGAGGLHGSVTNKSIYSSDEWQLEDVDVASFYPNLGIVNGQFPQHLSSDFCVIYKEIYDERQTYPKSNPINGMLKLALNGVYGESNSDHDNNPFLDPQYTMTITINGQLSLLMLAEALLQTPLIRMVQANTDGLTLLVHKSQQAYFKAVCDWWQQVTKLELEYAHYREMHIRDVNSYIAVTDKGKIKRIGAYAYVTPMEDIATREVQWHKDHSHLIVPRAAEHFLVHRGSVQEFIWKANNMFDFAIRVKAPRTSTLAFEDGEIIQNTSRVHVSHSGRALFKHMPPLARNPDKERVIAQLKGWKLTECNDMRDFDWHDLNRDFYVQEANKLVSELTKCDYV